MVANIHRIILILSVAMGFCSCQEPIEQVQIEEHLPIPETTFDLNTVSHEQLLSIDGINKGIAKSIIEFRKKATFRRVEDLLAVEGIGEKTFLWIRRYFHVTEDTQ